MSEPIRGFHHLSKAWYAEANLKGRSDGIVDEVTIGLYYKDDDGGTDGEFAVRWHNLRHGVICPCLQVFDDSWEILRKEFDDVLVAMMALDNESVTPDDFCRILQELGLEDLTKKGDPDRKRETVVIPGVDMDLLDEQRRMLWRVRHNLAFSEPKEPVALEGVLNMLDAIFDARV